MFCWGKLKWGKGRPKRPTLEAAAPITTQDIMRPQGRRPPSIRDKLQLRRFSTATSSKAPMSAGPHNWGHLLDLRRALEQSAEVFGPLKAVVDDFIGCIDAYDRIGSGREEYENIRSELDNLFEDLQGHFKRMISTELTKSMEGLCKSIQRELAYLREKQEDGGAMIKYLEAEDWGKLIACYRRIQGYLQRLSLNANLPPWAFVDERARDARLDCLCHSSSAYYNSAVLKRGPCSPGTRIDVIAQIRDWVYNSLGGAIYWLDGTSGTGKTTILYTVCAELDVSRKLGASFFCSHLLPECRDVNLLVPSIAYQLARFSRPLRSVLSRVLEKNSGIHSRPPHIQFEALIVQPLIEVQATLPPDVVVVIDALDECNSKESTLRILDLLATKALDLPIKFIVSSRPVPEIRAQVRKRVGDRANSRLTLHELDQATIQLDIRTYLETELFPMKPTDSQIAALVERAGTLFIFAATIVRYLCDNNRWHDSHARLDALLNSLGTEGNDLDKLYSVILGTGLDDPSLSDDVKASMKRVLFTVICALEPLTIGALSGLLELDIEQVRIWLQCFWAIVHIESTSELVTTLHFSFPEFMFESRRSSKYYCDSTTYNEIFAKICLSHIKSTKPWFNICGLESSFVVDEGIEDLEERAERSISKELFYACRYWAIHLHSAGRSLGLIKSLEEFLSEHLLLWMEVMNIKKNMHAGAAIIQLAEDWYIRQDYPHQLTDLVHDAWQFVTMFASNPVSRSTPHIYMSMLPFWPKSSPISRHYTAHTRGMIKPEGTALTRQRLIRLATWSFGKPVLHFAFSPNGASIALSSRDNIYVLDAFTGRVALGPLEGHTGPVTSVNFSPGGTRIVSCSHDKTLLVWDLQTGKIVLGPLKGHTYAVTSVRFSPDGTRIVSGSRDKTLRVWNSQSGQTILGPLKGHTNGIVAIGWSPDGTWVVSGSRDKTIRVWDSRSGEMVVGPIEGHTDWVLSVRFSPDGNFIVSGSRDKTIRVYEARIGKMTLGPLEGHTDSVESVGFSPDGTRIVSGSADMTIRVWNSRNGQQVLGPLEGHTSQINAVSFSPDGTRIVSSSHDHTIRAWDARTKQLTFDALEGHNDAVTSVGFSPEGTRIVSGSRDNILRLWDARSGEMILEPLEGHTGSVTSTEFSPDGVYIASGSSDTTIRLWDSGNGRMITNPLQGHTSDVSSIGFSPDGARIVSGSYDETIRLWDIRNSQTIFAPLRGHTSHVSSVSLSPDGSRIVSGSHDKTICVWDAQTRNVLLGPLHGHSRAITSVKFSPDGTRIASGSRDNTIRVWGARDGRVVLGPLQGHTDSVTSIAFSRDGSRIVSSSDDYTICIWDSRTGQMVLGPLQGHTDSVLSVGFSPDGTYIVSGSADKTIRVWEARNEMPLKHASASWKLNKDGWVVDSSSRLLIWVPPHLHNRLMQPRNILLISTAGHVSLNFDNAQYGDSWANCYLASPEPSISPVS